MSSSNQFNFAGGICHFTDAHIVITDHGNVQEILRRKEKNTLDGLRKLLLVFFMIFVGAAVYLINIRLVTEGMICIIPAVMCMIWAIRLNNRTNIRVMEKNKIMGASLQKKFLSLNLVLYYKNPQGKIQIRNLPMKSDELIEVDKALHLLRKFQMMSPQSINAQQKMLNEMKKNAKASQPVYKSSNTSSSAYQSSHTSSSAYQSSSSTRKADKGHSTQYKRDKNGYLKDY